MKNFILCGLMATLLQFLAPLALAAPKAELWPRWQAHDAGSAIKVDHTAWQHLLNKYLDTAHQSGINRFQYQKITAADRQTLSYYLQSLGKIAVSRLNQQEQKAYWINLYNALTVKVILDHYPVQSIRDIDISPGFFSDGPWGKKLVKIEGVSISLDDIEHRILRPIWQDNRVHYAVNCASLGCPNLQPEAFTAANTDMLLDKGAREYINHSHGVKFEDGKLLLSSIYDWFREDFGGSEQGVRNHLQKYSSPALSEKISKFNSRANYFYDWSLNE